MGKLTIELKKETMNQTFKDRFNGKVFEVNMPDLEMEGATDKLKKPANLKDADKLKKMLKDLKPVKEFLFSVLDDAVFASNIDELGSHDFEVKFKGNVTVKGTLKLLSSSGDETRVVISNEPRKLGAHPKSVKLENLANAAGSGCPAPSDLAHLLKEMAKTNSYVWSGKQGTGNGWTPVFDGHFTHDSPDIAGHKSYVDEPSMGTGTLWRLRFNTKFIEKSEQLVVDIHSVKLDKHK